MLDILLDWVADGGTLLFAAQWDDPEVELPGVSARIRNVEEKKDGEKKEGEKKNGKKSRSKTRTRCSPSRCAGKPG